MPAGSVTMVVPLEGWAEEFWNHNVPRLVEVGLATELDSHELCAMCEWWAEYRKWQEMRGTEEVPINDYRRMTGMAASYKQFRTIAAKFGLTPTDRVGLVGANRTEHDELADLIA